MWLSTEHRRVAALDNLEFSHYGSALKLTAKQKAGDHVGGPGESEYRQLLVLRTGRSVSRILFLPALCKRSACRKYGSAKCRRSRFSWNMDSFADLLKAGSCYADHVRQRRPNFPRPYIWQLKSSSLHI